MHELPKSLAEIQLEAEIERFKRENDELRWERHLAPDAPVTGYSADHPNATPEIAFKTGILRLAVGAGWERHNDRVQYFGYVKQPERYEIGVWIDNKTIWNKTSAIYHLDNLNRNIQGQLLDALLL